MRVALDAYHVIALERVVLLQRLLFQVVFHKAVAVSADPQVAFSVEPEFYGIAPKLPALGIESTGYQRIGIDDVDIVHVCRKEHLVIGKGYDFGDVVAVGNGRCDMLLESKVVVVDI